MCDRWPCCGGPATVRKFDDTGKRKWRADGKVTATNVKCGPDGNIVALYAANYDWDGVLTGGVTKYTDKGKVIWRYPLAGGICLDFDEDSNVYVGCGSSGSLDRREDPPVQTIGSDSLYCISADGELLWSKATGGEVDFIRITDGGTIQTMENCYEIFTNFSTDHPEIPLISTVSHVRRYNGNPPELSDDETLFYPRFPLPAVSPSGVYSAYPYHARRAAFSFAIDSDDKYWVIVDKPVFTPAIQEFTLKVDNHIHANAFNGFGTVPYPPYLFDYSNGTSIGVQSQAGLVLLDYTPVASFFPSTVSFRGSTATGVWLNDLTSPTTLTVVVNSNHDSRGVDFALPKFFTKLNSLGSMLAVPGNATVSTTVWDAEYHGGADTNWTFRVTFNEAFFGLTDKLTIVQKDGTTVESTIIDIGVSDKGVLKLSSDGQEIVASARPGKQVNAICVDSSDKLIAGTSRYGTSSALASIPESLWKFTSTGTLVWKKTLSDSFAGLSGKAVKSVCGDDTGNVYAAGEIVTNGTSPYSVWAFTSDGTAIWKADHKATVNAISATDPQHVYIAGQRAPK